MNAVVERTRQPRMEVEKQQRRRRDDLSVGRLRHLDVTNKDPNYEYRWVNDDPGRLHQLTVADDWDIAPQTGEASARDKGVGTGMERVVDKRSGKRAILLRKPKQYYLEDKAKEQALIDETEKAIKRGQTPAAPGVAGEALQGAHAYVPSGGISISRG